MFVDPRCRYAAAARIRPDVVTHVCVRNTGQPIGPSDDCYYETARRLRDRDLADDVRDAFWDAVDLGLAP